MDAKDEFFATLKSEFAPRLREVGFRGSGRDFRRVRDEIINVVNIQGWRHGGQCALNIGLHLMFLPDVLGAAPDPKTIKEMDCEFRGRVRPDGESDYWWEYGSYAGAAQRSARHLISTYFAVGEPYFQRFATVDEIVNTYPPALLAGPDHEFYAAKLFGTMPGTRTRAALVMARISEHRGDRALAKQYAEIGLANVGRATGLVPHFNEIIAANS